MASSAGGWRTCWRSPPDRMTRCARKSAWTMVSRQLLGEVTPSLPPAPGRPAREDYEYVRQGVCNLFLVCEPLRGWRHVTCSQRRTCIDWAHCVKELVGAGRCPLPRCRADRAGARQPQHPHPRVAGCGVPTGRDQAAGRAAGAALHPRHGSWLNMAEVELAMLTQQCLDRRLADQPTLQREVAPSQAARNAAGRGVNWPSSTE